MREHARRETGTLLRRMAFQLNRVSRRADAGSVHDLRVSVRRLSRCLRTFASLYRGNYWKKIRVELHRLMEAAGAVRDRDIALELLAQAGVRKSAPLMKRIDADRRRLVRELSLEIHRLKGADYSRKWRNRLEL